MQTPTPCLPSCIASKTTAWPTVVIGGLSRRSRLTPNPALAHREPSGRAGRAGWSRSIWTEPPRGGAWTSADRFRRSCPQAGWPTGLKFPRPSFPHPERWPDLSVRNDRIERSEHLRIAQGTVTRRAGARAVVARRPSSNSRCLQATRTGRTGLSGAFLRRCSGCRTRGIFASSPCPAAFPTGRRPYAPKAGSTIRIFGNWPAFLVCGPPPIPMAGICACSQFPR